MYLSTKRKIAQIEQEFGEPIVEVIRDFLNTPDYFGKVQTIDSTAEILGLNFKTILKIVKQNNIPYNPRKDYNSYPSRLEDLVYTHFCLSIEGFLKNYFLNIYPSEMGQMLPYENEMGKRVCVGRSGVWKHEKKYHLNNRMLFI